mmetsp:Transcript_14765/g.25211  ORF Transcript_14765/g.25211 Transcript_14765/m.25211 type:complete len:278 (-) Transcript_14765:93-926(-)
MMMINNPDNMESASAQLNSRDDIMAQIANQAASVRRTFEANQTRRKNVSSATAAAAHHMASLNRKRKFENNLAMRAATNAAAQMEGAAPPNNFNWNTAHTRAFHSPIAGFTRPEKKHSTSIGSNSSGASPAAQEVASPPRVSDGIVLKASPHDITVSYNDVVCGKGKTTSALVGNQRFKVWISLYKERFAKALYEEERRNIARCIVNAVTSSVPQGRFLSLDIHTGLWYDVGYERATAITMETLMTETGMMRNHAMMHLPHGARPVSVRRTFTSKAA